MGCVSCRIRKLTPDWQHKLAVEKTIDRVTDSKKLKNCVADRRNHYINFDGAIDEAHWIQMPLKKLPRLFVLTLVFKGQNYPVYVNEEVYVCDLMDVLTNELSVLPRMEACKAFLSTVDEKNMFELDDCIGFWEGVSPSAVVRLREASMHIIVKPLAGDARTLKIPVDSGDLVELLKRRIFFLEGIPVDQQRLIYAGRTLEDSNSLLHYNIMRGAVIHLVIGSASGKRIFRMRRPVKLEETDAYIRKKFLEQLLSANNHENEQRA